MAALIKKVFASYVEFFQTLVDSVRWSLPYLKEHKKTISVFFAFGIVAGILSSANFLILRYFIDDLTKNKNLATLNLLLGTYIGSLIVINVCNHVYSVSFSELSTVIVSKVKQQLFQKYLTFSIGNFEDNKSGTIINQITTETQTLETGIQLIVQLLKESFDSIFYAITLSKINFRYSLLMLVLGPVFHSYWMKSFNLKIRSLIKKKEAASAALCQMVLDSHRAMRVIRVFGGEDRVEAAFKKKIAEYDEAKVLMLRKAGYLSNQFHTVDMILSGCVFFLFGRDVVRGAATPGEFVVFITLISVLTKKIHAFASRLSEIMRMHAAGKNVLATLAETPKVIDSGREILSGEIRELRFEEVGFDYGRERGEVFSGAFLSAKPGDVVVILGENGAGKTTLLNLIPRLYDPASGRIIVNGQDIKGFTLQSLRRQISLVAQGTGLIDDTIYNNILVGKPGASESDVIEAARRASAHEFIEKLPKGYETNIGEDGAKLSQGQRQKITIARAYLKDAPILLLDEPFTSVDAQSSAAISETLLKLSKGRITILITHHLDVVPAHAKIYYLKQKTLVQTDLETASRRFREKAVAA